MERPDVVVTVSKTRGANRTQQNRIKALMFEGYNAFEISDEVRVEEDCVKNFMEHFAAELGVVEPEIPEEPVDLEPEPEPAPKKVSKKKAAKKD